MFGKWHPGWQSYTQSQNKGLGRQTKSLEISLDLRPPIVKAKRGEFLRRGERVALVEEGPLSVHKSACLTSCCHNTTAPIKSARDLHQTSNWLIKIYDGGHCATLVSGGVSAKAYPFGHVRRVVRHIRSCS
jgi:hypothetical protein